MLQKNIARHRLALKLKQTELARLAGLSSITLSRLETGNQVARPATMRKIRKALATQKANHAAPTAPTAPTAPIMALSRSIVKAKAGRIVITLDLSDLLGGES